MSDMGEGVDGGGQSSAGGARETTGRTLLLLRDAGRDAGAAAADALRSAGGLTVARSADPGSATAHAGAGLRGADAVVFDRLGVAVIDASPDRLAALTGAGGPARDLILATEPERVVRAAAGDPSPSDPQVDAQVDAQDLRSYLRGFRDGVRSVVDAIAARGPIDAAVLPVWDETTVTWGLGAVGVPDGPFTGRGVRVAVLDTGVDLAHPDFAGRTVVTRSFVDGATADDGNGHGTHCAGTACGPLTPASPPRYGVAPDAELHAGKVLSDAGSGSDRGILAGLEWAVATGCRVVSLSLGSPAAAGEPYSRVFEAVARRALDAGTAMVAAAGNDSHRSAGATAPVGHPANCPSILAVAALDRGLTVAGFSNGSAPGPGGQVDLAAPGVDVRSSWPVRQGGYRVLSGTSMATPHVAGVIALLAEANPDASARELLDLVVRTARRLPAPSGDVGAGIVRAPAALA